jgi:hypothetical protein
VDRGLASEDRQKGLFLRGKFLFGILVKVTAPREYL